MLISAWCRWLITKYHHRVALHFSFANMYFKPFWIRKIHYETHGKQNTEYQSRKEDIKSNQREKTSIRNDIYVGNWYFPYQNWKPEKHEESSTCWEKLSNLDCVLNRTIFQERGLKDIIDKQKWRNHH